jgi:hypothetical protein
LNWISDVASGFSGAADDAVAATTSDNNMTNKGLKIIMSFLISDNEYHSHNVVRQALLRFVLDMNVESAVL